MTTGGAGMQQFQTLENYLHGDEFDDEIQIAVTTTILRITAVAMEIADLVARGPLAGQLNEARGDNTDGDVQKELDLIANDLIVAELKAAPVGYLVSEELDQHGRTSK